MHMAILAALALVLPSLAAAQSKPLFPVLSCPAIGDEYEKMISKLDTIKTSIKRDANCDDVALKVKSLEELVTTDRQTVMDIIAGAQSGTLTADQSRTVRNYAENVTKKVAALNDLFTQSNYCFRGDKPDQQLSSLAGFVGEAANMVGSLAGPWGVPIALAGNVVAGFLTGMDQIFKTRAGYDFKKSDQWISYVNNLCTYHSYREQIEHLLNPSRRIEQLQRLKDKLSWQIEAIANACPECQLIRLGFENKSHMGERELLRLFSAQIETADQKNKKPYGSYIIQSLALRDWATGEIRRVQKEAKGYWSDAAGRHLLTQAKSDIEQFLLTREAPRFVAHGINQARQDYAAFKYTASFKGYELYDSLERSGADLVNGRLRSPAWADGTALFRALVLQPIAWDRVPSSSTREELQAAWIHYRDQAIDQLRTSVISTQLVQTFCSFFRQSGAYSPEIRSQCTSTGFVRQVQEQDILAGEITAAGITLGPLGREAETPEADLPLSPLDAIGRAIDNRAIGN